ncbi:glycosyltransferase [Tropicimonas sediminicola]|uniref:Glycosyl transferases group 1 n=1 Tax=Tropicimonas sediminicola TaxID=1031541 RepID=A0A239H3L6_9RHOB|nr:glycosyltransferase [Tropicimonas sediminicola]SNS75977.1 Glycosyl transferases group 1 [Tropicimonas sediminicola]
MRVLYITRDRSGRKIRKRMHRWAIGFIDGQDGFFEAALHEAVRVTRMPYEQAIALSDTQRRAFDAVVVNGKAGLPWQEDPSAALDALRPFNQPVSLFVGHAQPEVMPPDALLDRFKVVFKREPFADTGRYGISDANAAKIVPTHLANPMVSHSYRLKWRNRTRPLSTYAWQTPDEYDVFFIGTVSENRYVARIAAWEAVLGSDLTSIGGLLPKPEFKAQVPPALITDPLPKQEYREVMMRSSINLALEGIGPFTFRHLEQFWAGAFTLSTNTIRPLRLRAPLVEDQDYVAFDTIDEMMDKIRWYLEHDDARKTIAQNGRKAYERLYDVPAHAAEIRAALTA